MSFKSPKMTNEVDKQTEEEAALAKAKNTKYVIVNKTTKHNPSQYVDLSRKLLCVEYPGIVDNVDKMMETLGGMYNIEMAVGNYNRRLELKFRAGDIFSKPCWGDKDFNSGILVKITARQPKLNPDTPSSSKTTEPDVEHLTTYRYEVVGVTAMTFKFTRLCDFQYLPLVPTRKRENANTECRNIYESIMPQSVPDFSWFLSKDSFSMPLFFPPPIFAKYNSSKENKLFYERYKYYEKVIPEVAERLKKDSQKKKQELKNVIDRSRTVRKANSIFTNFNVKDVKFPQGPHEEAMNAITKRGLHGPMEKVAQLFRERPIWSKSALLHKSGVRNDRLKVILPALAYYFPNGPWRIMWCRFGYDPRLNPSCRIYQSFDFRVRASDGLKVKVQAKRSYTSNLMHYRAGPVTTEKFSLKNCSAQKTKPKASIDESFYMLKPGMLPPARQMFYQYSDLDIPEIQEMLARLPEVTKDTKCHYKNGWLPNGFNDHCREIVNKYITNEVKKLLLEEKEKRDEEQVLLSMQDKAATDAQDKHSFQADPDASDVRMVGTIVIDDDDEDKANMNHEDMADSDGHSGVGGEDDEMSDSDDERTNRDDDDIDLEAVEEINKLIGNMNEPEPEPQTREGHEEKEDSEEEFDPELVSLYHKLIVSNTDTKRNVNDKEQK